MGNSGRSGSGDDGVVPPPPLHANSDVASVLVHPDVAAWLTRTAPAPGLLERAMASSYLIRSTRRPMAPPGGGAKGPGGADQGGGGVAGRVRGEGTAAVPFRPVPVVSAGAAIAGAAEGPLPGGVRRATCGGGGGGGGSGAPNSSSPRPPAVSILDLQLAPHSIVAGRWVLASCHMSVAVLSAMGLGENLVSTAGNAVLDLEDPASNGVAVFFLWYDPSRLVVVVSRVGATGAGAGAFYLLNAAGLGGDGDGDDGRRVARVVDAVFGRRGGNRTLLAVGWSEGVDCQFCHWRAYGGAGGRGGGGMLM
ncbi:hypothetical protein MMPV_003594 [Pyropia vietnamensis]